MSTSQVKTTTTQLNPSATEFVPTNFVIPNRDGINANNSNGVVNGVYNGGGGGGGYRHHNNHNNYSHNNHHNPSHNHNNHYNSHHHNNQNHHYNGNNNNNNNSNNHFYQNNNRSSSHNNYSNGYNNNYNNNYRNNNNSMFYNNGNAGSNFNHNDVDPIEIEARCEAVVEILQDDQIRDQLNPVSRFPQQANEPANQQSYYEDKQDLDAPLDDEEELLEMMAMQEECRLEMMKFYIQSQNPNLFEEIYHDVSYPDAVKKTPEQQQQETNQTEDPLVPLSNLSLKDNNNSDATTTTNEKQQQQQTNLNTDTSENSNSSRLSSSDSNEQAKHQQQQQNDVNISTSTTTTNPLLNTNTTNTSDSLSTSTLSSSSSANTSLKDLILNQLNPCAHDFVPVKFSDSKENDESTTENQQQQ